MAVEFIWDDLYSVGRADIDDQHKSIFSIANTVPDTLDKGMLNYTIMRLYLYTTDHFSAEEQMMKDIGFPKLEYHKALHDELTARLQMISTELFDDLDSLARFKEFFHKWIVGHILTHDMEYFEFARSQGGWKPV